MRLADDIAYRQIGQTYVAALVDSGRMLFLNETAGLILESLDSGYSEAEIIQQLCRRFDIEENLVSQDVADVLREFARFGFVQGASGSASEMTPGVVGEGEEHRIAFRTYCEEHCVPLNVLIEITDSCNLRCSHCYVPFNNLSPVRQGQDDNRLQFDNYKRLLNELRDLGCFDLAFTGGEPFVSPHLMSLCEYARKLRFSVSIKTNAALIDDRAIEWLRRTHITEVQTSLYSMNPEIHDRITSRKGSWTATTTALRKMRAAGQKLRLACIVMQSNFKHLAGLREFAKSIDAAIAFDLIVQARTDGSRDSVLERLTPAELKWLDDNHILRDVVFGSRSQQSKPDDEIGYSLMRYPQKDTKSRVCGAANTLLAISTTGQVFPCVAFNMPLGNVFATPLKEILANPETTKLRSYRNGSFEECAGCEIVDHCPRCMATNYLEVGHPLKRVRYVCEVAYWYAKDAGVSEELLKGWSSRNGIFAVDARSQTSSPSY